jgi:hypothetical protein
MTVAPFHLSLEGSLNSGIEADVVRYDEAGDPIYQKYGFKLQSLRSKSHHIDDSTIERNLDLPSLTKLLQN